MQDSGYIATKRKTFKNLLVRNHWTDFNIIWQKCSFGDPLPRLFKSSWFVKNVAARGWGLFSLYSYIENIKKSPCQEPLVQFQYNLAEIFLWWPSTKIVQIIMILRKHGRQGAGLVFPLYLYRKLLKIFLSETTRPISIQFCRNVPLVTLYQDCSSHHDSSKYGRQGARFIFSLYLYRKI